MTRSYPLWQVDVFTETPLEGNPLAVIPDARGLSRDEMQAIAREMNLSETTFVLPAEVDGADYFTRIFTPRSELRFAGHPTVGTAHVLLEAGRLKAPGDSFTLHQQTHAGVQPIDVHCDERGRSYTMTQPTPTFAALPGAEKLLRALGVSSEQLIATPLTVSVGVAWHVVALADLQTVSSLLPDMTALAEFEAETGVATTVFCREAADPECSVRVRSFAPGDGITEDPVCGSGNGCVGAYIAHSGLADAPLEYRAEQGIEMGRPGRLQVRIEQEESGYRVQVGGRAVSLFEGTLSLPAR